MDENKKAVILDITKGVMTLKVDLTQLNGKLMAYGALTWAQENIEGWFLQQDMIRQEKAQHGIIKPKVILPNGNGDAA